MKKKPVLFLIHFAGGNRYSFNFLTDYLHTFDFVPLELPGRGKRFSEQLLFDFEDATEDIAQQILYLHEGREFVVYGHSLGSLLGLAACSRLNHENINHRALIVSGNPGPGAYIPKKRHDLPKDEFVQELKVLGGLPEAVVKNAELFDYFEPVLRADFKLAESNIEKRGMIISAPIYALMGRSEENADKIENWRNFTKTKFSYEVLNGDHFFIHDHPATIAYKITESYEESTGI
ncbi:MAG: alpha/beta fold hydrolase [Myxococcota bacterium]|nr:alpha/beta fold hydrolase [Myxococcota bacterium]